MLILLVVLTWLMNGIWALQSGESFPMPSFSSLSMNLNLESDSLEVIIDQVALSVVTVRSGSAVGSGFVFQSNNYILTNAHVISQSKPVKIELVNGEVRTARIAGRDRASDIAVLQVRGGALPVLSMGNSNTVRRGQSIFAIGSPLNLNGTVTNGIVSAIRRSNCQTWIQTSAAINPGNSGGPLFDQFGRVIGVNTKVETIALRILQNGQWRDSTQHIPATGIGMAISINNALQTAHRLIRS
jgi:S1-C subfamily serine protease